MSPDTPKPESKLDKILKAIESTSKVVSIAIPGMNLLTGAVAVIRELRTNANGEVEYFLILTTGKENLDVTDANADYVLDLMNSELVRQGKPPITT